MNPKQWLKKFLPKRHEITNHRHLSWLGSMLHDPGLWHFNRRSVASGAAVGVIAAFIPLPIQMVIAALLAVLTRSNIFIAIAATWITNPVTFLPLNFFIFKVGQYITNDATVFTEIDHIEWHNASWLETLGSVCRWLEAMGKPFLVGLPIVASVSALMAYLIMSFLWIVIAYYRPKQVRKRRELKKNAKR